MLRKLCSHLAHNVVGYLGLFVALGGSAYAVTSLPKNSVGTKQLKTDAVTSPKIKNGTIVGADINKSKLGKVPLATRAANAGNAAKLGGLNPNAFLASGGKAVDAAHADTADNASNASHATNADTLDGLDSSAFAPIGHNHDSTYVNEGQSNSVTADMVVDPHRAIPLPLNGLSECSSASGGPIGFAEGSDANPDLINSATAGQGLTLRWDNGNPSAAEGGIDEDTRVCGQLTVPADYVGNPVIITGISRPTSTGNLEQIQTAWSVNGGALSATDVTSLSGTAYVDYGVNPTGVTLAPGDTLAFFLTIHSPNTQDDDVDLHSVAFRYDATQ